MNKHEILQALSGHCDADLFLQANAIKQNVFGEDVYLRAIIEFSNFCNKRCHYCGLRAPNTNLNRYRMEDHRILETALLATAQGAGTIVLQSGDDFSYSAQRIGALITAIKAENDVAITLSLGDRGLDEYAYWKSCGAERCLLKLETTTPRLYKKLRGGESFSARLHRITSLKNMGYEVGSGVIIGLPDTDILSTLRDILFLSDLNLDMIAAGPFVPHPQTPLGNGVAGDILLAHRVTAILRILNPWANIPATSALGAVDPGQRILALHRGCNVLMPSLTPEEHRREYTIYPGKNLLDAKPSTALEHAKNLIAQAGLVPSPCKGTSPRREHAYKSTPRDATTSNTHRHT